METQLFHIGPIKLYVGFVEAIYHLRDRKKVNKSDEIYRFSREKILFARCKAYATQIYSLKKYLGFFDNPMLIIYGHPAFESLLFIKRIKLHAAIKTNITYKN